MSNEEQEKIVAELGRFTGNVYGVDHAGNLTLLEIGGESSQIGTKFLDELIAADDVFQIVSSQKRNRFNQETGIIEINFKSFEDATYGRVDPRTFNLGSTVIHELHHASTGLHDTLTGERKGVIRYASDWVSPTVAFVNQIRAERGLARRAAYIGIPAGLNGKKEKIPFSHVNPKRPEKVYYVVRKRSD